MDRCSHLQVSHSSLCSLLADDLWRKGADKLIKLWEIPSGEFIQTLEGHTEGISDIAWSFDGEYLASASDDKTIRIWSMEEVCSLSCRNIDGLRLCDYSVLKPEY